MKRIGGFLFAWVLFAGIALLFQACNKKDNPAAPAPDPTATFTPCVSCTLTFTSTETSTRTQTSTPTPSATATWTATPSNTRTATLTPTPTLTRTTTWTPTETLTPTVTPTPTSTPTPTLTPVVTATATCPDTPVPTQTPSAPVNYITGTLSYGPGGVGGTHTIGIDVFNSTDFNAGSLVGTDHSATNGFTYRIPVPTAGPYYIAMLYNTLGDSNPYGAVDNGGPAPGSYYSINGGGMGGCAPPGTAVVISGGVTQNFSFGNGCAPVPGFYGTASYGGSQGPVNACHPIVIEDFYDSALTSPAGDREESTTNGGNYNLTCSYNLSHPASPVSYWVRAYYDQSGTGSWVSTDDAVTFISNMTPNGGTTVGCAF